MSGQGDEGLLWSLGSGGLEPRHLFIMQTESLPTLDWTQNNSNVPQQEDDNKMILYKNIIFLNPKYFVMLGEVWNVSVETVRDEWCVDSLYGMGWHQNHAGDCSVPHLMNVPSKVSLDTEQRVPHWTFPTILESFKCEMVSPSWEYSGSISPHHALPDILMSRTLSTPCLWVSELRV